MLALWCVFLSYPITDKAIPSPDPASPLVSLLAAIWRYEDRNDVNCSEIRLAYAECCGEEGGCGNCPWMYECMKNFHFTAAGLRGDPPPEPSPSPEPSPGPPVLQTALAVNPPSLFAEELRWLFFNGARLADV